VGSTHPLTRFLRPRSLPIDLGVGRQPHTPRPQPIVPSIDQGQCRKDSAGVDLGVTEGEDAGPMSLTGAEHGGHRAVQVHRPAQLRPGAFRRDPKSGITEDPIRHGTDPCRSDATQAQPRSEL
jgi:hypothetical protein